MAFLSSMNIAGSGMTAQRARLDIISENIASMEITRTENGGPYRRKNVVFASIEETSFRDRLGLAVLDRNKSVNTDKAGVKVVDIYEDQTPFKTVYNPSHPDADEKGYVLMPNVNMIKETADSMAATRAYEANITALNAIKFMASKALEIGR